MTDFSIFGEVRKKVSKASTLDFERNDYSLFRTLVSRIPWETLLKEKSPGRLDTLQKLNL